MKNKTNEVLMKFYRELETNEFGGMIPIHSSNWITTCKELGWIKLIGNVYSGFIYYHTNKKNVCGYEFMKIEYDKKKPYAYRFMVKKERE